MLLFCQALQPSEICWLRWCDFNFTTNSLLVVRNRSKSLPLQPQIVVNYENIIDYLLGAYLLFPRLPEIPDNYWLAPCNWRLKTLPKTSKSVRSTYF